MAKKILIVDDDKDLVQTLEAALKFNNYEVVKALQRSRRAQGTEKRKAGSYHPGRHDGNRYGGF